MPKGSYPPHPPLHKTNILNLLCTFITGAKNIVIMYNVQYMHSFIWKTLSYMYVDNNFIL